MKKPLLVLAMLGLCSAAHATLPQGWYATGNAIARYDMGLQPGDRHADDHNAYIRAIKPGDGFGGMMQMIDSETYRNQRVRLSGYLKTGRAGNAALWLRVDGSDHRSIAFDNMQGRSPHGDTQWQRYNIVLDVPTDAADLAFGFFLDGQGEVLADDFKLEIVSKDVPLTTKPRPPLPGQPVNMDFAP